MIIYKCTCTLTNKSYIGQTTKSLRERWKGHCYASKRSINYFPRAIRKYGEDAWHLEILEEVEHLELLNEREIYWIAFYNTFHDGYNSTSGGENGKLISKESRMKMSMAKKGKGHLHTEETKQKLRKPKSVKVIRKPPSDEARKNMSLAQQRIAKIKIGIKRSEESRRNNLQQQKVKREGHIKRRLKTMFI